MASFSSHKGTVKWWSNKKGYGFIKREDGQKDIFVHRNDIQSERRKLCEGVTVRFEIKIDSKGRKYANVIKIYDNLAIRTSQSVVWSYVIFLVAGYIRRSAKQCPEDIILLISNNVYRKERDHERIERAPAEIARAVMPSYLKYYHMTNSKLCDPSKWHQFLYEELNDGNTALAKALIQHKV